MILRDYQTVAVSKALEALEANNNTLLVAPTGAGKTVILSHLVKEAGPAKALILQHRDELVDQNVRTFSKVNPDWQVSQFDAGVKSTDGRAVFAMVQTVHRHTDKLPRFDMLVVDEAHHAMAETYRKTVDSVISNNPGCKVVGFTATPARGDGKGLRKVFDNVGWSISMDTLIKKGFIVPPKTFVSVLPGVQEALKKVRKTPSGEYDLNEAAEIMNHRTHNRTVVEEWSERAISRKSLAFCSTIKHAMDLRDEFKTSGYVAETITGDTPERERSAMLKDFDRGNIQVMTNVAVLTEGYDSQAVSCVMLLRPCSFKSTMVQMIGRGLRIVDNTRYPNIIKSDCIVLDFGTSLLTHGNLYVGAKFEDDVKSTFQTCFSCGGKIPAGIPECPICGADLGPKESDGERGDSTPTVLDVEMIEVNILNKSPFKWCNLFDSGKVMVASGFSAQAYVATMDGINWTSMGKREGKPMSKLTTSSKAVALMVADDFMRENEDNDSSRKSRRWMSENATEKQIEQLHKLGYPVSLDLSWTKYSAACHQAFGWNVRNIERILSS